MLKFYGEALRHLVNGDWKKAYGLVLKGIEYDCPKCIFWLGDCYAHGYWVNCKNMVEAEKLYKRAADLGDKYSMYKYKACQMHKGLIWRFDKSPEIDDGFTNNNERIEFNEEYSRFIFDESLEGNMFALCQSGIMGKICEAVGTYNYAPAINRLGWMMERGEFKGELEIGNMDAAIICFRRAAEQNHRDSQYKLAVIYSSPEYRNMNISLYWCLELLKQENPDQTATEFYFQHKPIFESIIACKRACFSLIAIRKYRDSPLSSFPKDIVTCIAKKLWETRDDY